MCAAPSAVCRVSCSAISRQAEFHAGGGHGFDQQEEVRRAAAGDGGDGVQLLLSSSHRAMPTATAVLRLLALFGGHFGGGVQAAHALTQQRRGVGHAAHDRLRAEPVFRLAQVMPAAMDTTS
jgi:hypothetical protein